MERSESVESLDDILNDLNSDSDESFTDKSVKISVGDALLDPKANANGDHKASQLERRGDEDRKEDSPIKCDDGRRQDETKKDSQTDDIINHKLDEKCDRTEEEKTVLKTAEIRTEKDIAEAVEVEEQRSIERKDQIELNNNVLDVNKNGNISVVVIEGVTESESNDNEIREKEPKLSLQGVTEDDTDDFEETRAVSVSRSHSMRSHHEEDIINQFLDVSNDDAEARLLARRQARAEAREIRMRELERQQKEQEENADRQFDMLAEPVARAARSAGSRYLSSRRSSEDSLEDGGSLMGLRHELKEMEEKFKKAMIANAQLDNDKAAQTYQLELLKDRLEELEEEHSQLKREHRDKCREHDQLTRLSARLKDELAVFKAELEERDRLIEEKGLVIVGDALPLDEEQGPSDGAVNGLSSTPRKALVSVQNAHLLENAGEGSLDVRLERFAKEKVELQDQISHMKLELEEERSKRRKSNASGVTLNGPTSDSDYDAADLQREVGKQLAEYKFRAQKAEQDVATLQANVARLESQVIRYKSAAEVSEKSEEALKAEKRKLQREARDALSRAEELETSNTHLLKRLDKLKTAKSALLKEL